MTRIDPKNAKTVASFDHPAILYALCADHRNGLLYAGSADWAVHRVHLNSPEKRTTAAWMNHGNYVSSLLLLGGPPREEIVVSGSYDGSIVWTRARDGGELRRVEAHDGWVRDLALSPDRTRIASVGDDMRVRLWDAESGRSLHTFQGHPERTPEGFATALYAVAFSPDGRHVASGDRLGEVRVWDAREGELAAEFHAPEFYTYDAVKRSRSIGGIRALAFSPEGGRLAVAGIGQVTNVDGFVGPCRLELWDWQAGKRAYAGRDSHKAIFNRVGFHPDGSLIVTAGGGDSGGLLAFWDGESEEPVHKAKYTGHIQDFCFDEAGTRLYAAGHAGLQVWDLTGAAAKDESE